MPTQSSKNGVVGLGSFDCGGLNGWSSTVADQDGGIPGGALLVTAVNLGTTTAIPLLPTGLKEAPW